MKKKLLRLCNKIFKSSFNFVEAIVLLEEDKCTLSCLNRNHTVFLEIDIDLDYFQGKYAPTEQMVHFVHPEDIINQELDLERELVEFEQAHLLSIPRLHHFFYDDYHEVSFKKFKSIAESDCDNILIECNGFQSMFISHYLKEPLLDIPDTFALNLHTNQSYLSMRYTYDFFTVKSVIASRITPPAEAQIILEVD